MKKLILSVVTLVMGLAASAQVSTGQSEWLTEFSEVNLSGPFSVVFEQAAETEAPRIVYDTKGSYTSKFKAEVKNQTLFITEKAESRRATVTEVKVYFHSLSKIRVTGAAISFAAPFTATMLDIVAGGGATVDAAFDITDLLMDVSGRSRVILSGEARYFTLAVSTASVDASKMRATAVRADASNGAEVTLCATERLEAKTSTNARILFSGNPAVVRGRAGFTGGEVVKLD